MNLTEDQVADLKQLTSELFGDHVVLRSYGKSLVRKHPPLDLMFEADDVPDPERQVQFVDRAFELLGRYPVTVWFNPEVKS